MDCVLNELNFVFVGWLNSNLAKYDNEGYLTHPITLEAVGTWAYINLHTAWYTGDDSLIKFENGHLRLIKRGWYYVKMEIYTKFAFNGSSSAINYGYIDYGIASKGKNDSDWSIITHSVNSITSLNAGTINGANFGKMTFFNENQLIMPAIYQVNPHIVDGVSLNAVYIGYI